MLFMSKTKATSVGVILILLWLCWPVYQNFAHKGKIAFPPFYPFITLPSDNPTSQNVHDIAYRAAGDQALTLLSEHKVMINAPAISAAVAIDGKLVWAGASGWTDVAAKVPATPDTQFRIGSTSKALTGTALARMVDAKAINIDRPISS